MTAVDFQQRFRHANFVVQVATGRQHRKLSIQNRGEHFLAAGFTAATGQRDDPTATRFKASTIQTGDLSISLERVINNQLRHVSGRSLFHNRSGSAGIGRIAQKSMPVKTFTAQRNKQTAWTD